MNSFFFITALKFANLLAGTYIFVCVRPSVWHNCCTNVLLILYLQDRINAILYYVEMCMIFSHNIGTWIFLCRILSPYCPQDWVIFVKCELSASAYTV